MPLVVCNGSSQNAVLSRMTGMRCTHQSCAVDADKRRQPRSTAMLERPPPSQQAQRRPSAANSIELTRNPAKHRLLCPHTSADTSDVQISSAAALCGLSVSSLLPTALPADARLPPRNVLKGVAAAAANSATAPESSGVQQTGRKRLDRRKSTTRVCTAQQTERAQQQTRRSDH